MTEPLTGDVVVDLSQGIAGAYAGKLLADAGARVIKVEGPAGDPLRRHRADELGTTDDSALFGYLHASKESVTVDPADEDGIRLVVELVEAASGVLWSPENPVAQHPELAPERLAELAPHATVASITPFGRTGPWADRPATEATLQAWAGSAGQRGSPDRPPLLAGGQLGYYEAGVVAAVSYLASRHRTVLSGVGELVDVSALEAACLTFVMYPGTYVSIAGSPRVPLRVELIPGVYCAKDGFVGFMVVTGQQWQDFCAMVERPEWADDPELAQMFGRLLRGGDLLPHITAWMAERTCAEIAEFADLLRIPVAVLGSGQTLLGEEHLLEQGFLAANPRGGFTQPSVPYRLGGSASSRPFEPAPQLGEHTAAVRSAPRPRRDASSARAVPSRPFEGLRVADFTANWAGPIIGHVLGMLGADVIKIESASRPDALRFNTIKPLTEEGYWEWSPLQHGPNTSKRSLTLDMASERGAELAFDLLRHCDVALENFSPRVSESWGLTWDKVSAVNPGIVFVRAPAYGLAGPWRDRVGYAQTIEMTSGLAWVTGWPDGSPDIPNGVCDPNAGLHALVGLLVALEHRRRTGQGMLLEAPMIGGALNVAGEQIVTASAHGVVLERIGNRSPVAVAQGIYRTATDDLPFGQGRWVAISAEDEDQWQALATAAGIADRDAAAGVLDEQLAAWCAVREVDAIVKELWEAGVPVAKVVLPHEQLDNEQLRARQWFTTVTHPVTGANEHGGFPARFGAGPSPAALHRSPPPTLGQHNGEILGDLLGLSDDEIARLEADGIVGTRVPTAQAW